jgi:hypothetical protein
MCFAGIGLSWTSLGYRTTIQVCHGFIKQGKTELWPPMSRFMLMTKDQPDRPKKNAGELLSGCRVWWLCWVCKMQQGSEGLRVKLQEPGLVPWWKQWKTESLSCLPKRSGTRWKLFYCGSKVSWTTSCRLSKSSQVVKCRSRISYHQSDFLTWMIRQITLMTLSLLAHCL